MPLKLIEPRQGKTTNYSVRGTYLRVYVDRSTGSPNKEIATRFLNKWKREIERGEFSPAAETGPTFLSAALAYIKAGGEARFVGEYDPKTKLWSGLIGHFSDTPLGDIGQEAIDEAASVLHPAGSAATKNRQVYTPMSAILKRAGIVTELKRPKGARGNKRVDWLTPKQAFALFEAADQRSAEYGLFIRTITYTGMRLSEALRTRIDLLDLSQAFLYVPKTKNENPRGVHLPPVIVSALANHPRGLDRKGQKIFKFSKCGRLYTWWQEALDVAGIALPPRSAYHILRHTWGTWMRQYGGLDTRGLVGTGAWDDEESAARYAHVVVSEEAKRADLLPVENKKPVLGKIKAVSGER